MRFKEQFAAFDAEYGYQVLNALQNQERRMREAAAEMQAGYEAANRSEETRAAQDASMFTTNGLKHLAATFTEAADTARQAAEAWEKLQAAGEETV